ncbi:hypothetical protein [Streptomyces niveus]|uniref:hypothetical protein n=1 Tax=Streptomyces niveus TaxID=193462 RepID=UPI00343A6DCC
MRDGEWYLGYYTYDHFPGAALHFGPEDTGIYCLTEPTVAFADPEVADAALPGEDGVRLGRDYQRSAAVTFELGVDTVDTPAYRHARQPTAAGRRVGDFEASSGWASRGKWQDNLDGVDMLRQVWRADSIRLKPSRIAWLVHRTGGRTRRLYGRPRKFDVAHSRLTRQGYTPIAATFTAIDDRFYSETERSEEMWVHDLLAHLPRPGRPGGTPRPPSTRPRAMLLNEGSVATYPVIQIEGPAKNPLVEVGGLWTVQLSLTLSQWESVTIDPRPWRRTVTRTSATGAESSVADRLTRASPRLADMVLPPGLWPVRISHTKLSPTSTVGPRVKVLWRSAYTWW